MKIELLKHNSPEFMDALIRLMPQLTTSSPIPEVQAIDEIIAFSGSSIWVALNSNEEIVGMLTLAIYPSPTGLHGWIEDVVVDSAYRHQGYGQALTNKAIEHARQSGAKSVSLTSRSQRIEANQLYRKMGFELLHTNLYRLELTKESTAIKK